jgi:hypothetical protein
MCKTIMYPYVHPYPKKYKKSIKRLPRFCQTQNSRNVALVADYKNIMNLQRGKKEGVTVNFFQLLLVSLKKGQTQYIEAPTQGGVWGGIIGT